MRDSGKHSQILADPSLKASLREGMSQAAMLGAGETYLSAFAIFLQGSAMQIGLLGTAPQLCGAFSQIAVVRVMEILKSRRNLVTALAQIQSLFWLLIAVLPWMVRSGPSSVNVLIAAAIFYFVLSGLATPVWSSLIGDLVPAEMRGKFFGKRSEQISLLTLLSIFGAGQILDLFKERNESAWGFAVIFCLAFFARQLSAHFLAKHADPPYLVSHEDRFSFWDFLRRMPQSNFARFVFFLALLNFSVWVAAPYFSVYMLRDLKFSYLEFTMVSGAAVVVQIITLQHWGALMDRFGSKRILEVSAKGVALLPLLWLFGSGVSYLIVIQVVSGLAWAGFNLAASNFLFDAVSPPKRGRCVAYQSAVSGLFVLLGSLVGGALATHFPHPIHFFAWFPVPQSRYLFTFFLSGLLRVLVVFWLMRIFKEVREVENIRQSDLMFRIAHVRPLAGLIIKPIVLIQDAARRVVSNGK